VLKFYCFRFLMGWFYSVGKFRKGDLFLPDYCIFFVFYSASLMFSVFFFFSVSLSAWGHAL
jgi:hypothetical protein